MSSSSFQHSDDDSSTRGTWRRALADSFMLYPDEQVVRFLACNYGEKSKNRELRALDVGFGSGRHLALLLDYGFRTSGIEYLAEAIDAARETFARQENFEELYLGDYREVEFKHQFDVITSWGVEFLSPPDQMKLNFRRLAKLLTKRGKLCTNFRTKDNWFFGLGEQLSENSYRLDERAHPYSGSVYTFMEAEEIEQILRHSGFEILEMEEISVTKAKRTQRHSWLSVVCQPLTDVQSC